MTPDNDKILGLLDIPNNNPYDPINHMPCARFLNELEEAHRKIYNLENKWTWEFGWTASHTLSLIITLVIAVTIIVVVFNSPGNILGK